MSLRTLALAVVAVLAAWSHPVSAQEPSPSHLAAARELVMVSGASASIDDILPALLTQIRQQAVTRPEMTKDLDLVLKSLQPELDQQRQAALTIAARAYAKWLTEPEIKDLVAFFKTPSGAKYVKVLPELTDDVVNGVAEWSQQFAEYVQTRTRAEMQKRGHQMQ